MAYPETTPVFKRIVTYDTSLPTTLPNIIGLRINPDCLSRMGNISSSRYEGFVSPKIDLHPDDFLWMVLNGYDRNLVGYLYDIEFAEE